MNTIPATRISSSTQSAGTSPGRRIFRWRGPLFALPILGVLCSSNLFAQTQPQTPPQQTAAATPAASAAAPERDVITYLDRQIAQRDIEGLIQKVRSDLLRLYRLKTNIGKTVENSAELYGRINDQYRAGMDLYYKKEFVRAYDTLSSAHDLSLELYKKFGERYATRLAEIMSSCSESLVNLEMEVSFDTEKGYMIDNISENHFRLKIAYNELGTAEHLKRTSRHDAAIDHYRLAMLHAIRVLENLTSDSEKKAAIESNYRNDIIDAKGGIATPESAEKPESPK